jgi:anaerobic selenocysteine-containing dehydrogenase
MRTKTITKKGTIQTLCRQCDMRCGLNVQIAEGRISDISGFEGHPQNLGRICHKGRAAADLVYKHDRLLRPLKKNRDGTFTHISYEQAIDEIADRMLAIKGEYGARSMGVWKGEALGFFQQEEYARRFIHAFGSPNYFSNDSECFNGRYIGYGLVQGYWNGCPDFENANLVILWGSNLPFSHPPFMRLIANARAKGAKLVVIDPRLVSIAYKADLFVQPLPGTDGALAWGLANHLIETQKYDRQFVERHSVGFDQFAQYAKRFTPEFVEKQTGVDRKMVTEIAELIIQNMPRIINYVGNGLEHHENGINNIRAVACLGGLCGAIDIRGGDTWPEGMGGRELTLYDELPLTDQKPIGADKYPVLYHFRRECHTMTAMDHILGKGEYPLRGMIVTGANPVLTNPNAGKVAEAFRRLDLLVVRELFLTETAKLAQYVLPAASFLERSELHYHAHRQMVTLTRKILAIPGVQDEYTFWRDLAHRLDFGETYFPWRDEEEVTRWVLEPTGVALEELKKHPEGYVYEFPKYKKYEDRPFPTPTGRFEFLSQYLRELGYPELPEYMPPRYKSHPDQGYPLVLITGARKYLFYHSRYRNIERFRTAIPDPEVEIHPQDATRLGIKDKDPVRVTSEIGSIEIQAKVVHENEILPGVLQITHGWDEANVNLITDDSLNDPISGFPALKAVPVKVEKVDQDNIRTSAA